MVTNLKGYIFVLILAFGLVSSPVSANDEKCSSIWVKIGLIMGALGTAGGLLGLYVDGKSVVSDDDKKDVTHTHIHIHEDKDKDKSGRPIKSEGTDKPEDPEAGMSPADLAAKRKAEEEAKRKAEKERLAKEKAERERLAREEAERKRKAEEERLAREKAERERLAREEAERKRKALIKLRKDTVSSLEDFANERLDGLRAKKKTRKKFGIPDDNKNLYLFMQKKIARELRNADKDSIPKIKERLESEIEELYRRAGSSTGSNRR